MRNDLAFDLCEKCGEYHNLQDGGIFATINHPCNNNVVEYKILMGLSTLRLFKDMFTKMNGGRGPMDDFYDLLQFPYLKAMENYETATYMDKYIYSLCRDLDIVAMKRLRVYIKLEEELYFNY